MTARAFDSASTFAVLGPDQGVSLVDVTPGVFEELNRRFNGFHGHVLVSQFSFERDWAVWEKHPAGDEIVCLLSGRVTFELERAGGNERVELTEPGTYVVVPRDTWHTAHTSTPTRMLFITPGEGTQNRPA
jgi:quercetin dioxygenase-like cupin family protein